MDGFGYQQQSAMGGACEGTGMDSVVCPKPRRFCFFRCPFNHDVEMADASAATELLEIILPEAGYDPEMPSPPFFLGSPPSRASNPLAKDARFMEDRLVHPSCPAPPSPSARNGGGGCARTKFVHEPTPVRIEGFNCSISTMA